MVTSMLLLDGTWRFRPDPQRIGELYREQLHYSHAAGARWCEPETDISAWLDIAVPGLWTRQGHPDLECGWYRLDFRVDPPAGNFPPGLSSLVFDGVDYFADAWLNGHYLGSHEGCSGRFRFDVSDLIGRDNALVVRVDSPPDVSGLRHEIGQLKRLFRGALERWDMNDPETKPAGIWGSVRLERTGLVRIASATIDAVPVRLPPAGKPDDPVPVEGYVGVVLEAGAATRAKLHYSVRPHGFEGEAVAGEITVHCRAGARYVGIDLAIPDARLWWTWDLGSPHRYEVALKLTDGEGRDDSVTLLTGFRSLEMQDGWDLRLNGVPFYQRGVNYLSDLDLSSMTAERYCADIALMRDGNINTVHPFAVVEGDAFYEACDASGLIVYQDFPIWMMSDPASDVVRAAIRTFDGMLARHGHHPSIAIWNFGSQPSVANFEKLCVALVRHARRRDPSRIAHHGNSAISYSDLDDLHPERSFFWAEASGKRFEQRYGWRRDCHIYPGWYLGDARSIATIDPGHFALVTEFGAQSLPRLKTLAEFTDIAANAIVWADLAARCGQPELLRRHNPEARTLSALVESSQRHQAEVVRHDIEFIRCRKLDGGHGLHVFCFNDCWPAVTWSVVEYDRVPKPAYAAMQKAMSPVQVFLEDYLRPRSPGQVECRTVVVNDTAAVIEDAVLAMSVTGGEPPRPMRLPPIPAHGGIRAVASLVLVAGVSDVVITMEWSRGSVSNDYRLRVV